MALIRAYKRDGTPLCEFENPLDCKTAFTISKSTLATFGLPLDHPKATAANLTKGVRIAIFSENGVETWGGFIIKRTWQPTRLGITCTSQASMLMRRRTRIHDFTNKRPGEIVQWLLAQANSIAYTGILPGFIDMSGTHQEQHYRYDEVYKSVAGVVADATMEWGTTWVSPTQSSFNLYKQKGRDKTADIALILGYDIEQATDYEEDESTLTNSVFAIGDGTDWNQKTIAHYQDVKAIRDYELAEGTVEPHGMTEYAALRLAAQAEVNKSRYPRRTLKLEINNNRGLFAQFTDGDIVAAHLPGYAFTGLVVPVRVLGREVDEETQRMTLAAQVVEGDEAHLLAMYSQAHYGAGGGSIDMLPSGSNFN